jgi:hypothetical protein
MKKCTRCQILKTAEAFPARRRASDGKASWCRYCHQESWRERYYSNHTCYKQRHAESRNRLRQEKAQKVYEYLLQHPCADCGECDPVVLEFDHQSDQVKTGAIAQMVIDNYSWKRTLAEIEKCEVRCANCHRRKTAASFGYRRFIFSQ